MPLGFGPIMGNPISSFGTFVLPEDIFFTLDIATAKAFGLYRRSRAEFTLNIAKTISFTIER